MRFTIWGHMNLEMLVFAERGKPEYPEKNLSEQNFANFAPFTRDSRSPNVLDSIKDSTEF